MSLGTIRTRQTERSKADLRNSTSYKNRKLFVKKGGELYECGRPAKTSSEKTVATWATSDTGRLYNELEKPNWAPWLSASPESLAGRAKNFPEGQLLLLHGNEYVASLSLNQICWDGVVKHLPSWDDVAGDPTDFSQTYQKTGNTLVLLSMNVAPDWKGKRIPSMMITAAQQLAKDLGVDHLIGSFRPSGYGEIKKGMQYDLDFETYCLLTRHGTDKPLDPWLGSLWHMGMKMVAVDHAAMTVAVTMDEFYGYQQRYHKGQWEEVKPGIWECGEVGNWTVDTQHGMAVYRESNVWGILPI